ncbi:MAG: thiamine pyrophosphate-binding protein, partial [Firmicutes bacterium]|nr:thiamine pyrophosphate-binding protein [Bacillota bacterium]
IEKLPDALRKAFKIANSGRKGPVLIDITKDVTAATMDYKPKKPLPLDKYPKATKKKIEEVAKMINKAERPVVYYGGGVVASRAEKELNAFLDLIDAPSAYTLMAAGCVGNEDHRNLGLIGMHGSIAANRAIDRADLIIALGTRFSDRVALNPKKWGHRAKKIQVDIDRSEVDKNVIVDKAVISDIKDFIETITPMIKKKDRSEWVAQATEWKKKRGDAQCQEAQLHPKEIIDIACDKTDNQTIYVTDVGQHQMWAAQYLKHCNTQKFLTSGGLGTMGYGYGAAIGAQIGCPDRRVIHFTGDGSFHMNMNEACTAVSENLPIITIIFDNKVLGMVYQWQTAFYGRRFSATTPDRKTDYVKVAEGFGAKGYTAATPEEFEKAFDAALKNEGPSWIACSIAAEERVLPMIPGGGTTEDMIIG